MQMAHETRWILPREECPEAFVDTLKPEVLWLLSIDRRLKKSRIEEVPQARSLAELMRGTSSVFLSSRYPVERSRLMPVLAGLASSCRAHRVRLGRDLLDDPGRAMERLLDASG